MSRPRRMLALLDRPDLPVGLLPLMFVLTQVRGQVERVRRSEDRGALSLELILLVVGLFVVAGALVVVITNVVATHEGDIH